MRIKLSINNFEHINNQMKVLYRPEIDGLRAISIIGVIFFHFKFDFFSGGYLGVDVFIVISGYLITSFIFNRLKVDNFSFIEFLIRRSKRLLPSFFAVIFFSLIFAYLIFLPEDLVRFCKSIISATFLSSNFFFWLYSGYWDESNSNPLLHTWSLSLEWQFYLTYSFFSVLIWKLIKFKFYNLSIFLFIFIFLSSFISALVFLDRNMSFFLLPFRLYEFLIGASIYFVIDKKNIIIQKNKNILALLGIFLIILSFIIFDSQSNVPGYIALMPCLGTAMLIYLSETIVHKFLRNKVFVYIGLISYSLYLYHWPILIFYSWINIVELDLTTKLFLIFLSVLLSILNYHTIEKPVRLNLIINKLYGFFLIPFVIIIILFSLHIISKKGFPDRFSDQKNKLIESAKKDSYLSRKNFLDLNIDLKFNKNKEYKILVLGDSNGEDMFFAIKQNLNLEKFDVEYMKFSAWCFELPKFSKFLSIFERIKKRNQHCLREENFFNNNSELLKNADYIIFSSAWYKNSHMHIENMINFVKNYSNANLIVSSKTVYFPDISILIKRIDEKNILNLNEIAYEVKFDSTKKSNEKLKKKINLLNIKYLDKSELICSEDDKICNIFNEKDNQFYIVDDHHWTLEGAKFYGNKINYKKIFNNY